MLQEPAEPPKGPVHSGTRVVMLVVRGQGVRVLRLSLSRRQCVLALGAVVVAVSTIGAVTGNWWWQSRQRLLEVEPLLQQVNEHRATIDSMNRRLAELRREMADWREMHARILEPFGPEPAPPARSPALGGPQASLEDRPADHSPGDELEQLTRTVMQESESLRGLDRLIGQARKALTALPMRWPVRGAVNSEYGSRLSFGTREFHAGIDIAARQGTPVHAPAAGRVVSAGVYGDYGIAVVLDHGDGLRTLYGHLSKLSVASGQKVARGAQLGLTGNTGRSSGPHLHYEILVRNRPVNPRAYLWN